MHEHSRYYFLWPVISDKVFCVSFLHIFHSKISPIISTFIRLLIGPSLFSCIFLINSDFFEYSSEFIFGKLTLGIPCKFLFVQFQNRRQIIDLINPMSSLQACDDDKQGKKPSNLMHNQNKNPCMSNTDTKNDWSLSERNFIEIFF